ncbi:MULTISPECIES: type VI secretion system membrane subunit TssM [unclassified Massilia]|uniref:type VI secretion system membrane subunit TssM n=1 Tax=unclassified Massilia TaxID=2609279 RepID=UPI001786C2B6|nr:MULTISPECIES: type VI secretion system membrane subunit TssM [unclassified Massilia]MBD8528372.1 type VI secretion system membrane subunit TssM [Massilia sp. CFBP 13647]MBD8672006.1 type VI secretion system membrane subunit TssM [Massilia sp. CFBP 13721]
MKRLFSWLFKRQVLALIGVTLLALVFWFEAPLLAFDGKEPFAGSGVRWFFILLMYAAWALWYGARALKAHLANRRLIASLAAANAPPAAAGVANAAALQEQVALQQRMQQAMDVLRKAAPGKRTWGSQYLYQLPWYMFVGAPGSGKTTALLHSGLRFPLADSMGAGAIGGVGGTRQCDWWFTDEAVLLDTAGRYTTQDSDAEADQAGWHAFLGLLKKHRPRRPINGIIVALSVADLLQQGPAARQAQAQAIRARIKELHERLGSSFPIYVTVTKCDLLAGFMEFFDTMGREERAQVWGITFPLATGSGAGAAALAQFPERFLELEQRLQSRVLVRLQEERDLQRRALLYRFPQQFAGLGEVLKGFLDAVFEPTRYEQGAQLRGVYFTSGTQEGSPIDRVLGALAATFGFERKVLAPNAAGGRSYFITSLLRDLVFKEAGLAGIDPMFEARRRRLRWLGAAVAVLLAVLFGAGLATSYLRNERTVDEVDARTDALAKLVAAAPANGSVLDALPMLNAARTLPGGYEERAAGAPLLERFGLNQGDKLGAGARLAYQRLLRSALLPRVMARIEEVLRRGDANNQEQLYETLRVYLMLGQPEHLEPESVQAWLDIDWRRSLPDATPAQRDELAAHVGALFDAGAAAAFDPPPLDASLVGAVRSTLALMPLPERVYNRLKRKVAAARLPETSVNRAAGHDVSALLARKSGEPLTRGVPGLFSVAGYRELLKGAPGALAEIAKDSWVLDRREAEGALGALGGDQMNAAVLRLYYADYIRAWDALLADVRIAPFSSLDQGARITNALAGADSPLKAFLTVAARETTLGAEAGKPAVVLDQKVLGKLSEARRKLEAALGGEDLAAPAAAPANPVDQHFAPLHKLVGSAAAPGTLDAQLALLKDASQFFDAADQARRAGTPAPSGEALQKVKRAAEGTPPPLGEMLQNVDNAGASLTLGSERARIRALWAGEGARFCSAAIAGRYPLVRGAARDATLEDFGKFFGPGGLMDDFFAKNLAAQVDMAGSQWRWRDMDGSGGAANGIPQDVLNQFQRAARIRDMFFAGGARQPSLRFDLAPQSGDPALTKVVLDIDGQPVAWAPGTPARPVPITLPSGKGGGLVHLEAAPPLRAELRSEGPWAWFRMIDKGTLMASGQPERYTLVFDLDGHRMSYQLTASSVVNPFRRETLEGFHCPSSW